MSKTQPKLKCAACNFTKDVPMHCGQPMHPEQVSGKPMLVCWMGPTCGKQEFPSHHNQPMKYIQ